MPQNVNVNESKKGEEKVKRRTKVSMGNGKPHFFVVLFNVFYVSIPLHISTLPLLPFYNNTPTNIICLNSSYSI